MLDKDNNIKNKDSVPQILSINILINKKYYCYIH